LETINNMHFGNHIKWWVWGFTSQRRGCEKQNYYYHTTYDEHKVDRVDT